jgi:hypothetical protein
MDTYDVYMYKLENPCVKIETCEEYMFLKSCKKNKKTLNYYNNYYSYPFYLKVDKKIPRSMSFT